MNNTSLTMAERDVQDAAGSTATVSTTPSKPAQHGIAEASAALELDEIHFQALVRLGHNRRRYAPQK